MKHRCEWVLNNRGCPLDKEHGFPMASCENKKGIHSLCQHYDIKKPTYTGWVNPPLPHKEAKE